MPKNDGLKRVDDAPVRYIRPASPEGGASIGGTGNADTLDGFHATRVPVPNAIPVTDGSGYLSPFVDPNNAMNGAQAAAFTGLRYIAPSARLMAAIGASDTTIVVSAPLFTGDESAILSHYSVPNEKIWIMGAGDIDGKHWRYPIQRGKGGTAAQVFPAGTEVINLGSASTGGFIYASSAYDGNSPYIVMRQNNDDENRSTSWKLQEGRLNDIPSWFKAHFPDVTDWNRFGLAAEDAFLSGGIYARYGEINGPLKVTGKFTVDDTESNARMTVGAAPAGFGQVFQDNNGQPVWSVVMPYPDQDGNRESDIVWTVNSFGERAIYFRREGDEWVLSLGGFDVTSASLTNGEFGIYPSERRFQFAEGLSLEWDAGLDKLMWPGYFDTYGLIAQYAIINGSLVNNGHTEALTLSVGGTDDGSFSVFAPPSFQYTSGTSSANPETDAEAGWLEVVVNGLTRYIPLYA